MRIGPDVAPFWGDTTGGMGEPSTLHALEAIVARSFMHRRLWLNDPDCLMLRARETHLSADERAALAAAIAASGGMLLVSDDMALLDREAAKLFRAVAAIGEKIDLASAREPILALDLMASGGSLARGWRRMAVRSRWCSNRGNEPATIDPAGWHCPRAKRRRSISRRAKPRPCSTRSISRRTPRGSSGPALIGGSPSGGEFDACRHRVRRGGRREIFRTVRIAPAWT